MVYGDRRRYLTALITLNEQQLADFARQENIAYAELPELADHQKVRQTVFDHVQNVNSLRAPYEQIRRFIILPHDFTQEAGELTPTLKLRRREVVLHYSDRIETLYKD